jgi:hypothetical protein
MLLTATRACVSDPTLGSPHGDVDLAIRTAIGLDVVAIVAPFAHPQNSVPTDVDHTFLRATARLGAVVVAVTWRKL